jgi:transcriptional regulator with XRE-family HTH domain
LRRPAGISQRDLARRGRIDRSYVQEIERGIANPSPETLAPLAHGLDLDLADLFPPTAQ